MYKAKIDFFDGKKLHKAGDQITPDFPRFKELLKKQIIIETKVVEPEKRKRGRPRKAERIQ